MPRRAREIPWLELRGGTYYVFWYDGAQQTTKRLSLRTSDSLEAQKRYSGFLAEGVGFFQSGGCTAGLTVSRALDDYWREHVATKVIDRARAEDTITHLKTWFKDTPLTDVDIPASRAYANARRLGVVGGGRWRKNAEGSDGTIRRELIVLKAAANHAAKWKRIGPSATPPTGMPSIELPAESRREALWLTREEFEIAVNAASGRLKDFMLIAYYTAGRRASIERLTRFQIDLQTNRINLRAPTENTIQRASKKRRPVVPIDPKIRPVIERLLSERGTDWLLGSPADMYRPFREHMEALGFVGKSHPHILRHSRATHLLQSGVSIYDVARLLGDTVATVERVYGHHCPDYLAEAINRRTGR